MHLKTKAIIVAVPVAVAVTAGVVVAVRVRRRVRQGRYMPDEVRASVEELLRLEGSDFVPDGLGTSIYQRKLSTLTDKQLLGIYALVKVGEVMRRRGLDLHKPSRAEAKELSAEFRAAMATDQGRKELVALLGDLGAETVQSMLADGMQLATGM